MTTISENKNNNEKLFNKEVLKDFPKIELHRHLEGSFPVKALYYLAQKNNLEMPDDIVEFQKEVQFPKDSEPDFLKFLSKFKTHWYNSLEDVYYITYESVKALSNEGIFYIELRFSPEHFSLKNDFDRKEVTKTVIEAGNKAAKEQGFLIKYLLTFNRNKQTQEEMIELYKDLNKLHLLDIVGIDLAGDELNFPPELFTKFFDLVKSHGVYKSTIHAGEVTPSKQIWDAIKLLHANRIGHGTSAITDEKLQTYLTEHNIALEQCITSNYQTGSWVDEKKHPLAELYRKGVPVTINSDDPFIQDTDLTDDYIKAAKYFNFSIEDFIKLNHIAINVSFNKNKDKLLKDYDKKVKDFLSKQ